MLKTTKLLIAAAALLALALAGPAARADTIHGEGTYANAPLGTVSYLGNPEGYMLRFTASADVYLYEAGHSYQVIHKYNEPKGPNWCGPVAPTGPSPDLSANPDSHPAWYRIIDVTVGGLVKAC